MMHKCTARAVESKSVIELFQGKVAWDGVVEVFELTGASSRETLLCLDVRGQGQAAVRDRLGTPARRFRKDSRASGYRGGREMKVRWVTLGIAALWWIPCGIVFLGTREPMALWLPVMGFYPWATEDSAYSPTAGYSWAFLSGAAYLVLALFALRKNSMPSAVAFALLLSLSSFLTVVRAWLTC